MRRIWCYLLALCALLLLCGCRSKVEEPILEMVSLDVGQGSATLLRTPKGDILVDTGGEGSQDELCRKLENLGVARLELLVLSHPDEDHLGGADVILERFETARVWVNGETSATESYARFARAVYEKGVSVTVVRGGDGISLGGVHLSVLAPLSGESGGDHEKCLVLLVRCASFGALIMGDADEGVERELMEAYGVAHLDVDVLCVGHHGSNDACSQPFLEASSPQYAVISCGAGNMYGHPDGRTLARLRDAEVLRTDLEGDIAFSVFDDGFVYQKK